MPDGDRFERSLRSQAWRKAYRLVCGKQPPEFLIDQIFRGVAEERNRQPPEQRDAAREILSDLCTAVEGLQAPLFRDFESRALQDRFQCRMRDRERQYEFSTWVKHLARAAQGTLAEGHSWPPNPGKRNIERRFHQNAVWEVAEGRFLGVVRGGIMKATGRSPEQQRDHEASLRRLLAPACESRAPLLFSDAQEPIRAPRRRTQRATFNLERLNQPLVPS